MSRRAKVTLAKLCALKRERQKITMLTCYDYSTARVMEDAHIDAILVGDTYAEVCLGHDTTLPASIDHMVTIAAAVRRGAPSAFLVGDMPYLSYQASIERAIDNAGRFMAGAGCDCVKVEVDRRLVDTVAAMSRATIPVMAHLGLRPQSVHQLGGYKAQATTAEAACRLLEDARMMEEAGACSLLLEAVPHTVARMVAEQTELPVIGCVSGPHCDGQVLVMHDILGFGAGHPPRSVKVYTNLNDALRTAFCGYIEDVQSGGFPEEANSITMSERELARLQGMQRERS